MANLNNLPNVPLITDALHSHIDALKVYAKEVPKISNVQSLVEGNQILREILSLKEDITSMRKEVKADRKNNLSRIQNSNLEGPSDTLAPLVSANNQVIPDFPTTPAGLDSLPAREIDRILSLLDESMVGNLPERKKTLRVACGLRPVPIHTRGA